VISSGLGAQCVARRPWLIYVFKNGSDSGLQGAFVRIRICVMMFMGALAFAGCSKVASTDELIEELDSEDNGDRIKAVRLLQHRQGDAAKVVPALIEKLKDVDVDVRWSAAIGLGYFGAEAEEALAALEEAKHDHDARVREGARVAISRIGGAREGPTADDKE
jgi:hypothetical protein